MSIRTLGMAAASALALLSAPALAGAPVAHVGYSDLNLTTPDGQAELQRRLDSATWKVCRYDNEGKLRTAEDETACFRSVRKEVSIRMAQVVTDNQLGG